MHYVRWTKMAPNAFSCTPLIHRPCRLKHGTITDSEIAPVTVDVITELSNLPSANSLGYESHKKAHRLPHGLRRYTALIDTLSLSHVTTRQPSRIHRGDGAPQSSTLWRATDLHSGIEKSSRSSRRLRQSCERYVGKHYWTNHVSMEFPSYLNFEEAWFLPSGCRLQASKQTLLPGKTPTANFAKQEFLCQ